jgi:hypothetical protein
MRKLSSCDSRQQGTPASLCRNLTNGEFQNNKLNIKERLINSSFRAERVIRLFLFNQLLDSGYRIRSGTGPAGMTKDELTRLSLFSSCKSCGETRFQGEIYAAIGQALTIYSRSETTGMISCSIRRIILKKIHP